MKFPSSGIPVYSGIVSTAGFQLGQFINSPDLGLVDFHGNIKGKGFRWQYLNMNLDGIIHHIQYGDYTYQDITVKGSLNKKLFNGDFEIKDPNADLHLTGLVDLAREKPLFDLKADIDHANLKALQITSRDIELSGSFNLNMEASSLSDMIGTARITNATLLNNGKKLSFDSLSVSSHYQDGLKVFKAVSNEFDITLTGDYNLKNLPQAFTRFLSRYYPAYIKEPGNVAQQAFTFDITTGVVDDYVGMIDNRLSGFNNSHITGGLNMETNSMTIDADIPQFSFKKNSFSDVKLKGSGDYQKLLLTGQVSDTQIADSLIFPQTNFSIAASNDTSNVTINTFSNQAINQANLSAQIRTFNDGLSILFNPSSFILNSKTWSIDQGGALNFRTNSDVEGQVKLRESNQEIRLWTEHSTKGNWNDLHASLQDVNLGDISPLLMKKDRIEGLISGNALVENPQNKFLLTTQLHTRELRFDNDSIGQVDINGNYSNETGMLTGNGSNLNPDHHIGFDLSVNLKDTTGTAPDRISLTPTNFELKYLNLFLNGIFSDIQGYITGNLDILGKGDNQQFIAKAKLKGASMKVNFTQVTYKIDDTEIDLKKDTIDLNNIRIRDRFGNTAIVKGNITHKAFQNMNYDVTVQTETRQMELLNTTYKDNQEFFGKAMGSGEFVLNGPESNLYMNIDAKASNTDSSYLTLPPARTRETGQANFLVERKYGREMNNMDLGGGNTNLTYDIHLDANPLVNIEVILDDLTGDAIKARGTGDLTISAGTSSPLTIKGTYDIYEGSYLFTFQSFLKKPFILRRGSNNYIRWDGDPYNATVHVDAMYTAEKVSFAPLANTLFSNTSISSSLNGFRDDVNVVATLTGNLFHPTFTFNLEFPNNNVLYSRPEVAFAIQQIEKNQNELNRQVTYLIVFNSFTPYENNTAAGFNPFQEFTYSTISGLLFGEVNKRLNQLLGKLLRNNNLTFNFTGSLYNRNILNGDQNSFNINQTDVNVSVGKSIFNDRAIITLGGYLDVPLQSQSVLSQAQTVQLLPDVTLEILLNKKGSVKATFFYRQDIDFFSGLSANNLITRYGTSLSYGKEFDKPGEIFKKKKKAKPQQDTIPAKLPDTSASQ